MLFSLNGFGQDCDKYLDKQTNSVNSKGVVLKILGKTADVLLGTNFSSLTRATNELQALDNLQYQACVQLQTIKNDILRDDYEARLRQTLTDMVNLINQSGTLPPEAVQQLVDNGINLSSSQGQNTVAPTTTPQATPSIIKNADDVPVPILPTPTPGGIDEKRTFPCQEFEISPPGVIRGRGMKMSSDPQMAKDIANMIALEALATKIATTIKSVAGYITDQTDTGFGDNIVKTAHFTAKIDKNVEQTIRGHRTVCEEYTQNSATQKYTCYVALEINEDAVLKSVHEELKNDPEFPNAIPKNYEKFKEHYRTFANFNEKRGIY